MQKLYFHESHGRHNLTSLNMRVHFYYCAIVALKINKIKRKAVSSRVDNKFFLKWLRNAQNNNVFPPDITSEIEWLRNKIISSGPDTDFEPMLMYVYETSKRASLMD